MMFPKALLFIVSALPAIYVFFAIQYSAITVPFWDHTELIHWLVAWHDGEFEFSSLWAPHNQTRPLVYRVVMFFNAILTDWDVRSEYIYLYLTLYGTFACHIWALHRATRDAHYTTVFPLILVVVSLLLFSPVGHNNHWWSMMFQLDAANFFIAFSMLIVFSEPNRWIAHIAAALGCWLASYTLTNGIFAFLAIGLVFQLSAVRWVHPNRWAAFWAGNLIVLLFLYLPGIPLSGGAALPTPLQLTQFFLGYLGAPVGGLLRYPYANMFDIPLSTTTNVVCGGLLVASSIALCWHARFRLRERHGAAMILYGFTIFAMISAVATGWGRAAFDDYGVSNANASRYTIFGAYLTLGLLYYVGAGLAYGWWNSKRARGIGATAATVFTLFAGVTYARGIEVYANAHDFNHALANAFPWGAQSTKQDKFVHPDPEFVKRLRRDLQRLEVGPYRSRQFNVQTLPAGEFSEAGVLYGGGQVSERFVATQRGLKAIAITLVTPNGERTSGVVRWQLSDVDSAALVADGTMDAEEIENWGDTRLKLPYVGESKGREYELILSSEADHTAAAAVALYASASDRKSSLTISRQGDTTGRGDLSMGLRIEYAR